MTNKNKLCWDSPASVLQVKAHKWLRASLPSAYRHFWNRPRASEPSLHTEETTTTSSSSSCWDHITKHVSHSWMQWESNPQWCWCSHLSTDGHKHWRGFHTHMDSISHNPPLINFSPELHAQTYSHDPTGTVMSSQTGVINHCNC